MYVAVIIKKKLSPMPSSYFLNLIFNLYMQ